jgi:hypothetical protein
MALLNIDWVQAKQYYLAGDSLPNVARRMGASIQAVQKHAQRHKWAQSVLHVDKITSSAVSLSLNEQGVAWKQRVSRLMDRHFQAIEAKDPAKLKLSDFDLLARITDTTDRTARRALDLDQQQNGGNHVHVHMSEVANAQVNDQVQDQVIDVDTVPAIEPASDHVNNPVTEPAPATEPKPG